MNETPLAVELHCAPTLCYATEQAGVPLVRDVRVTSREPLAGAKLELELAPGLGDVHLLAIPDLRPDEPASLGVVDYRLAPERLRSVREAERARLTWRVRRDEVVLASGGCDVEVLAWNEWPGDRAPIALLASFVTPNDPAVATVLRGVVERLPEGAGLTGYQERSPRRVRAMVRALYETIQALEVTYAMPPASFERSGQKVRLPSEVVGERLATCLDATVLAAACLEQMGLNPLVVIVQGHALVACWLVDERFPEGIVEDAARLRTLIALDELVAFDPTVALSRPPVSYERASEEAQRHLAGDATFLYALDVRTLRLDRYRPLPVRVAVADGPPHPEPLPSGERENDVPPHPGPLPSGERERAGVRAERGTRFHRWQEKLLDLTLRNRLLNFGAKGRGGLLLDVPDVALFEDLLAAERTFDLVPPPPKDEKDERDAKLEKARVPEEELRARRRADLEKGVLHVPVPAEELWSRARTLEQRARTDQEEGGASTLYAAVGFLRWFETPESDEERLAPLLLYPVALAFDRERRRVQVQRTADDPVANVTLVEKMRRDHAVELGAITALPADEDGVDVAAVLRAARAAIKSVPRWEVLEQAHLGIFTFTKFLMWKDLAENEDLLLQSGVVRRIATGEQEPVAEAGEPRVAELPLVLDADSTQAAAIGRALSGRSFVLQGPPGTGKSQTITNLIGAAMAAGKTVLFISEKMAALEVVHRRLESVGLGDFCLELHSHKSNKKQVLESIGRALERARRTGEVPWEERARELAALRDALDAYARALHRRRPSGSTFYEAQGRVLELREVPELRARIDGVDELTEEALRERRLAVADFATRAAAVEPCAAHPWRAVGLDDWSAAIEEEVRDALEEARVAVEGVEGWSGSILSPPRHSTQSLSTLAALARELAAGAVPAAALADDGEWPKLVARARAWIEATRRNRGRREQLETRWTPEVLGPELPALHAALARWAHAFAPLSWLMLLGVKKRLRAMARVPLADAAALLADTAVATQVVERDAQLALDKAELVGALGGTWESDDAALEQLLARAERARVAASELRVRGGLDPALVALASPATLAAVRAQLGQDAERLEALLARLAAAEERLRKAVHAKVGEAWPAPTASDHRAVLRAALATWQAEVPRLRAWSFYVRERRRLESLGLAPLADAHQSGNVPANTSERAFERWFLTRWLAAVRDGDPALRSFDGAAHHATVGRFAAADAEHVKLARRWIAAKLEARLPQVGANVSEGSETGILLREIKKKTRHLPVRRLLQSLPTLLPRLKPCFLMSPLSVAQYLPASGRKFDLVVFDEASQIGTHDGIGAIARGAQVVIVGDSKQLPPTTFFTRNLDDPDAPPDENDVVELESILDEAVAKELPQHVLGWHYRSRHESLIDFSNRHYYAERLHVFPAARWKAPELGVRWVHVPHGVYRSGSQGKDARTNPEEARVLVDHLVAGLRATAPGARTFGVVTFNSAQQELVLELLDEARARHPAIEAHFADALPEPVFVKNLENVQGDERDEILFSVTYAKDRNGRLRIHFGPLSNAGGERRLNVAITRARARLTVFSTLTHEQIDLSRTASVGTAHLRAFLEYAARGAVRSEVTALAFPGRVEREVADALVARGWTVHAQVGCGGYRVDLAVVDPERPEGYLLGVEADGPNYASAPVARDRDRLRRAVLDQLGWSTHRVWSPDWAFDPQAETKRLEVALEEAKRRAARRVEEEKARAAAAPPPPPPEPAPAAPPPPAKVEPPSRPYRTAALEKVSADPDAVHGTAAVPKLRERIRAVVAAEAPVHLDALARRVLACWGWTKLTPRARQRVQDEVRALEREQHLLQRGEFVWAAGVERLEHFRTPTDGVPRDAEQIPLEELAVAAGWVLAQNLSIPRSDLARETARLLGFGRVGKQIAERVDEAVRLLAEQGQCIVTGERVDAR